MLHGEILVYFVINRFNIFTNYVEVWKIFANYAKMAVKFDQI